MAIGVFYILFYFNEQSKIYLMASVLYTQYIPQLTTDNTNLKLRKESVF